MSPNDLKTHLGAFRFYGLVVGLILLAGYIGYGVGNAHFDAQQHEITTLQASLENIKHDNEKLTRQLNVLGVELEVQRLANQNALVQIDKGLQAQASLAEQLQFYQKVMAPELQEQGFVVDAFDVQATTSDNHYRFDLVMMQQSKLKNVIKGNLDVTITGSQEGKPTSLKLRTLMPETPDKLAFSFKYFQVMRGEMVLPDGFIAEKVTVYAEIYQFKKRRGDLTTDFDWQVLPATAGNDQETN